MNEIAQLLQQYPEYVSKEQLRIIAYISKRTARYYLLNGLIPYIDNGKKTRNYNIKMTDIVSFLQDRENNPERYRLTNRDTICGSKSGKLAAIPKEELAAFYRYLEFTLKEY